MKHSIIFLWSILLAQLVNGLDLNKACDEYKEQKSAMFSAMSTTMKEANLAGQCTGYRAIEYGKAINLKKACEEYLEQKQNLLGNLSTSFIEANQAGICMGAIYSACGLYSFSSAAQEILTSHSGLIKKHQIQSLIGENCNGQQH